MGSQAYSLEGAENVILAPVLGKDSRRSLPRELFKRRPWIFLLKFCFAMSFIGCCWYGIFLGQSVLLTVVLSVTAGLLFAHLVELQHECLHNHAFKTPAMNRLLGVLSGIFMFSSYSHYRYDHLRHHAYLGTPDNLEHFDYRFQNLNSISGFLAAFFDLNRFRKIFRILGSTFVGKPLSDVVKKKYEKHIKQEYLLYFFLFAASVVYSIVAEDWFFLYAWWLPSLLIAEGAHFMIELPEHFGLNTQTNPDVISNTRTVKTNVVFEWYVNGNNLHTAHHYHQGVPMANVRKLHEIIEGKLVHVDPSYMSFFKGVITGKVRHSVDETCMTR